MNVFTEYLVLASDLCGTRFIFIITKYPDCNCFFPSSFRRLRSWWRIIHPFIPKRALYRRRGANIHWRDNFSFRTLT